MSLEFDHERLEVYEVGRELNRELARLCSTLPRGTAESKHNLLRAGKSVTRNIGEAMGRWSGAERLQFLHVARGSAAEVPASLDELVDGGNATEAQVRPARILAWRVVSMLVALIKSVADNPSEGPLPNPDRARSAHRARERKPPERPDA